MDHSPCLILNTISPVYALATLERCDLNWRSRVEIDCPA